MNWESTESHIIVNPKLPMWKKVCIASHKEKLLKRNKKMLWLLTSGTTQSKQAMKFVGISKDAFLKSAAAVNKHINIKPDDVWLKVLPDFHVAGLSIMARAHLSNTKVYHQEDFQWSVSGFMQLLAKSEATLISLVPTQVFDLVHANMRCPKHVRAVFVGGGALKDEQYESFIKLGWPVLLTYGMTEAASQIATSSIDEVGSLTKPEAKILPHIKLKKANSGNLILQSESLLSEYAFIEDEQTLCFNDPKNEEGWFDTCDLGEIVGGGVKVKGRQGRVVKVLGEVVHLEEVERHAQTFFSTNRLCVVSSEEPRKQNELVLVAEQRDFKKLSTAIHDFNKKVLPVERLQKIYFVSSIPLSESGKILERRVKDSLRL